MMHDAAVTVAPQEASQCHTRRAATLEKAELNREPQRRPFVAPLRAIGIAIDQSDEGR
jgi:hypothetical protein